MAFNLKAFVRFTYHLLSKPSDLVFRWTPRRVGIFVAFYLLYPLFELVTWFSLLLDEIFFRAYRRVEITAPVFIVGNFRSGTTLLHRLLAKDEKRFSSMNMWEILFAPSIVQRKAVSALAALDRRLGGLVHKRVAKMEDHWHRENIMHRTSLREPEEDDYLLLHVWSALTIGLSSGLLEEAAPYAYFDTMLPEAERTRIMTFHRRCVQRHLHARASALAGDRHRSSKQYLAKNPALTPKLDSVYKHFPSAKIICLVRNPMAAVPSFVDMMQFSWQVLGDPGDSAERRDFVVDMARHWYTYPLARLPRAARDSYILVRYDDLLADPQQTVTRIYDRFGFELGPAYARVLEAEAERVRRFRSRHSYSLEEVGLTHEQIVTTYRAVFDRFGFDTHEAASWPVTRVDERPGPVTRHQPHRPDSRPGSTAKAKPKARPRQQPGYRPGTGG